MKLALIVLMIAAGAARADDEPNPRTHWVLNVRPPDSDDGRHLAISWTRDPVPANSTVLLLRRRVTADTPLQAARVRVADQDLSPLLIPFFLYPGERSGPHHVIDSRKTPMPPGAQLGEWTVVTTVAGDPSEPIIDEVDPDGIYTYAFVPTIPGAAKDMYAKFPGEAVVSKPIAPRGAWFNRARWTHLALILLIAGSLFGFTWLAKRRALFVRRLPGVDALEDAIGRSTEMGRPVLYVTGVEETQDIQTIASLLILGHVSKITAEYDTDIRVANAFPLTMVIAEEVVRQGYANAGRADAHRPENVMFITSEQFAFAAGVNGMILRERPATNIYFGRFYAESLMLAETGFSTGAVQIAGTAELTQLPFFISACDFTLIGEELFACSAYLTGEPNQMALLKAGDVLKVAIAAIVIVFTALATLHDQGYSVPVLIEDVFP